MRIGPIFFSSLVLAALVAGPAALAAKDNSAAQALLAGAAQQASLLEDSPHPFELDVDFTAVLDMPRHGHLQLRWEAKDRWWSKLTVGPYEQIKLKIGEKSYTLRNGEFTPTQITDLFKLLNVAGDYGKLVVKKDKQRVENGLTLNCMEAQPENGKGVASDICVNSATHEILSDTRKYYAGKVQRAEFSEFADFDGYRYPRKLELLENGKPLVEANVIDLNAAGPLDAQLTTPPRGAIERRECENLKFAAMDKAVPPDFGGAAAGTGSVRVTVTVLASGQVGDVFVVQSAGPTVDRAIVDALKKSRFKPAMCGSDPVETDITIETNFQKY